ncbi:MAG: hypothetical protein ACI9AF_001630, partial [Granulosicoccus sp.]
MRTIFSLLFLIPCLGHGSLTLKWDQNILTLKAPHVPGGKIETWYLEAYCKPGSTDRDWNQTLIAHETKLISATPTQIKLRCTLADGVTLDHLIEAGNDSVTFTLTAHNPTKKTSLAHWAQPCVRVGPFTGTQQDEDKYTYLPKSFIFLNGTQSFLPAKNWTTKARYTPGQVWCPCHVDQNDVNPRPLSTDLPSNGLIGCVSSDNEWLFATAWEPYQELFQGVIRCLHSDFRIGGLEPDETKTIRGKFYLLKNNPDELLRRYQKDFPLQSRDHKTLTPPPLSTGLPAPGKRVAITPPNYKNTKVHHTLYLPKNWDPAWKEKNLRYPLIVEYSGNKSPASGSTGKIKDSALGYGLTGGHALWLNLPFISLDGKSNQLTWWGDEKATVNYAKFILPKIIKDYGINPSQVILCGFSRGAIAVNYIGLYDDEIAKFWSGFVTHDHYDGERKWGGTSWGSPLKDYRKSATVRLARIKGRPVLISQNPNPFPIRDYLKTQT